MYQPLPHQTGMTIHQSVKDCIHLPPMSHNSEKDFMAVCVRDKRRRCYICPRKRDRKTWRKCLACNRSACVEHITNEGLCTKCHTGTLVMY